MSDPVVVVLLTYERTQYALQTLAAATAHLKYDNLRWYIADDGSREEHLNRLIGALEKWVPSQHIIGWHSLPNGTYGANANKAWHVAHDNADLTLFLEDDWELGGPLEIAPYVDLLKSEPRIGMVRLGYLNLNMRGTAVGYHGKLYWELERDADPYVFTGHPSLRHRRFREAYGAYPEGLNPGLTELAYAEQFRFGHGPEIVWPAHLGEGHIFGHIGREQSYTA